MHDAVSLSHINSSDNTHMPSEAKMRVLAEAIASGVNPRDMTEVLQSTRRRGRRYHHMCPSGFEIIIPGFREHLDQIYIQHLQPLFASSASDRLRDPLGASPEWYAYCWAVVDLIKQYRKGQYRAQIAPSAVARMLYYLFCTTLHAFFPFITKTFLQDIGSCVNSPHAQLGAAEVSDSALRFNSQSELS